LVILALAIASPIAEAARVTLLRTPDGGIQPQAAVDSRGMVHLIYFKGEADGGNVFYVYRKLGETEFSKPIKVNSQSGSVTAIGTIRGAQLALGRHGLVHVAWNGSGNPKAERGSPMLYARLNEARTAFEPQRNLMTSTMNLDGGGSTTMVIRNELVNKPSDAAGERPVSDAILVYPR